MEKDIEKKQSALLKILKKFNQCCDRNNIKYSVACGTALGTIREKGFIPWDGDVDIMMTLPEYLKLEKIKKELEPECRWLSYTTDKRVPVFFGRIYEGNVDLDYLEKAAYMDINVFSGAPKKKYKQKIVLKVSKINTKIFWIKRKIYSKNLKRKKNRVGLFLKILLFFIPQSASIALFKYLSEKWEFDSAENLMGLQGYYEAKEIIPKEWFTSFEKKEFETIKVPIVKEWKEYLKMLYGDYEKRVQYKRYS